MTTYFFVGDGSEVLACEAYEANAIAECKRLQADTDDELSVYSVDPTETTTDDAGNAVLAYPAEYAVASAEYDLPTVQQLAKGN